MATDSNISLLPALVRSVDGIQLATGDRVLVKNQDNFADNGIYAVNSNGSLSRTIDASASADFPLGMQVIVQAGTQTGVFEVSYTGNSLSLTLERHRLRSQLCMLSYTRKSFLCRWHQSQRIDRSSRLANNRWHYTVVRRSGIAQEPNLRARQWDLSGGI